MDELFLDTAKDIGGPIPVIGIPIAVAILAVLVVIKANEAGSKAIAFVAIAVGVVGTIVAISGYSSAKSTCTDYYADPLLTQFNEHKCSLIVDCHRGLSFGDSNGVACTSKF